jgi:hypothetical protein
MQRLLALSRALDSFGFDEQASACLRLSDSGSIVFKNESLQWQQWAVDAGAKCEQLASLEEYDSWMSSKTAALRAFDDLALPSSPSPPLMFDLLDGSINCIVGNSITKVCCLQLFIFYHSCYCRISVCCNLL